MNIEIEVVIGRLAIKLRGSMPTQTGLTSTATGILPTGIQSME